MRAVQPIRDLGLIDEILKILKRESYRNYFLFWMGINTGLRISDLLQLRVCDVKNKSHIELKEKKTGKSKMVFINSYVRTEINEYIEGKPEYEFLFKSRVGQNKPITRYMAHRILKEIADRVGLPDCSPHRLRKTYGYFHYKQKKDVVVLQKLFNHSAPSITLRYIGVEQDELDSAMEDFVLGKRV